MANQVTGRAYASPTLVLLAMDWADGADYKEVKRVRQHIGEAAQSLKVLPHLNSLMISARPDVVRELIHQPEIESAGSANVAGFGLIKPVKSEPMRINQDAMFLDNAPLDGLLD
jgi:hypothetical protein